MILIVGSNGMLGKEFVLKYPDSIQIDVHNCDISNYSNLMKLDGYNISLIINCAAYTNVDACEDIVNHPAVLKSNVDGVQNLVRFANYKKAKLIHFSTDYVFNGQSKIPYVEEDETEPIQYYGFSKLLAEKQIIDKCNNYLILRISWLFGVDGSNFICYVLNSLKNGNEIGLLDNQYGTPTNTKTIVDNLPITESGILHFTNNFNEDHIYGIDRKLSWYVYGQKIAELAGYNVDLIKPISHMDRKAKRPEYSILNIDRLLKMKEIEHWYNQLLETIYQIKQNNNH